MNVHPGILLKQELEKISMSQAELSLRTGISKKTINKIINGTNSITPETAIRLEYCLVLSTDKDAHYWNQLQATYDLEEARKKIPSPEPLETKKLSEIMQYAISKGFKNIYMERNGWKATGDIDGNTGKTEHSIMCGEGAQLALEEIIFDQPHEFVKLYFGTEWRPHLVGLAFSDNYIDYLYQFIKQNI